VAIWGGCGCVLRSWRRFGDWGLGLLDHSEVSGVVQGGTEGLEMSRVALSASLLEGHKPANCGEIRDQSITEDNARRSGGRSGYTSVHTRVLYYFTMLLLEFLFL
jgi:hypothetical protein